MSRKKFIFFCLVVIGLVCVSFFIEQMTKLGKNEVKHEIIQKEKKKPKTQKVNKKTVFEEQQVVVESVYPYLNLEEKAASENLLSKGAVVSVRPVEGSDEWVEIVSDPAKGYIQKNKLEPRKKYKEARERHRVKKLTKKEFKQKLDKELQQFVKEKGGEINLFVETVDEKFTYSFYGDEIKRTASSIKLPFIAYLMELVDEDEVQLDTKLTYTSQFKIDGTGIIQFEPFGKEYTIKELAELTIRYSDNVAYLMLLNYLGEQNFIDYLGRLDEKSPNNRAFSSARILTQSMKMVNELKKDNPNMKLLDQWLQESIFDDGVAIGIPSVDVNHKTGWMPMYTVSTDVALVKDKKNPYYLTIMTTGYDVSYSEQVVGDIAEIIDRNMLELAL